MSPDHLNEEGLAEFEEIEIPFSIIFLLSVLLNISYRIHFNGHFYIFGLLAGILFRTYEIWKIIQYLLFYWYFLLHFNYDIKQKERSSDSTQSRDQSIDLEAYQQILPESLVPTTEIIRDIRPQIHFLQNSHIDDIKTLLLLLITSLIFHKTLSICLCMLIFLIYMTHQRYNKISN